LTNQTLNIGGGLDLTNLDTFTATGSTVIFDGTTDVTSANTTIVAFNNVQIGSASAGGSLTTADAMNIDGTFSVLNNGATTFNIASDTVSFGGTSVSFANLDNWTNTNST